ncbi:MAG: LysR family transcriptional regulator [Prevotella sp.]|nr:LysR family transcriptional regulator [Prevotella sp.]MBR3080077.1 LysR family transcriptional regulator [Prevotella sp.]
MTVNAKDLPTNNLYINEIEQNTSPNSLELGLGKADEYTYSKTLAKLLRRFVRVAVPDQDQVYYSDIEMLDTLMLCGSITGTAEKCNLSASYVSKRITAILKQLDQRVSEWETMRAVYEGERQILVAGTGTWV